MNHITRRDLAKSLAVQHNMSVVRGLECLETLLAEIHRALISGKGVELRNFGTLNRVVRRARCGRNPKVPGSVCEVPCRYAVRFKPGKNLRETLARVPVVLPAPKAA